MNVLFIDLFSVLWFWNCFSCFNGVVFLGFVWWIVNWKFVLGYWFGNFLCLSMYCFGGMVVFFYRFGVYVGVFWGIVKNMDVIGMIMVVMMFFVCDWFIVIGGLDYVIC